MIIRKIKENYQNLILTLLIISGPVKPMLNEFITNLDITLIAFLIAAIDIFFQLTKRKYKSLDPFLFLAILLLLFFLMFISLFYTTSPSYSKEKWAKFALTIFCFAYPFFVENFNWKILLKSIYYIVIPLALWFIYYRIFYWSPENAMNRSLTEGFYTILGSYMGSGYLLSLGCFILVERRKWLMVMIIMSIMLALGSRGPLLFTLITILIVKYKDVFRIRITTRRAINTILVSFILSIITIYKFNFIRDTIYKYGFDRFASLFSSERQDKSANNRIELMSFAVDQIFSSPKIFFIGNGIGSFGIDFLGEDIKENPHNIFLETWYELGIIGFALIFVFLLTPFFLKRNTLYFSFILFAFLNCLKSNNLSGLWILVILYSIYITDLKISPKY